MLTRIISTTRSYIIMNKSINKFSSVSTLNNQGRSYSISYISNLNKSNISLIKYIGNDHPYKIIYIVCLLISSGLFITNYTIGKGSLFFYTIYMIISNYYIILLIILFVIYPLFMIILVHPLVVMPTNTHLSYNSAGMRLNNIFLGIVILMLMLISMFFILTYILPIIYFLSSLAFNINNINSNNNILLISNELINNNNNINNNFNYMSMFYNNLIIIIVFSIIIGISIQNILVNDISEMKWIKRYNMDNLMVVLITIMCNNIILIISSLSLLMVNNRLIIFHWTFIIINTLLISSNNMFSIILLIITIDIISVLNIIMVRTTVGEGIWYYLLYQSIITILLWYSITMDLIFLVGVLYYYKLGAGIGGYYIPNLYYYIMNHNLFLLVYVGVTNIILMYNPVILLSSYNDMNMEYYVIMFNMMIVVYIFSSWILSGYLFINNWLYMISISTIVLSNVYNIMIYIDNVYYNLMYYLYYFTITSIIIWYILVFSLIIFSASGDSNYYSNINNNNNSFFIKELSASEINLLSVIISIIMSYVIMIINFFLTRLRCV